MTELPLLRGTLASPAEAPLIWQQQNPAALTNYFYLSCVERPPFSMASLPVSRRNLITYYLNLWLLSVKYKS